MASTDSLLFLVVLIAGMGVAAQIVADRLQVPSVLFLLVAGVVAGPEGLGLVTPASFGESLPVIVGLSVAIIVFEGAFHLRLDRLRTAPREVGRLVTVGAAASLFGTAVVARYALGIGWDASFLIGSLLVATGPTVITPILDVVPVRDRVAAALETEGIVNDVIAAILAVATFEVVVAGEGAPVVVVVQGFAARLALGVAVGAVVGAALWYLLTHTELSRANAPQNARLTVLIGALAAYGIAEWGLPEAGIAAAATAGVVLGNLDHPYEDVIAEFKGDVTLLVLSFVFITLAALLSLDDLRSLGLGGLAVVAAVTLVARPVGVWLSTVGGRFTDRERVFMSAVGPRGIIPASVATLFAIELRPTAPATARALVGTVFLVIFATVVFQGGLARHIAQGLNVIPRRVIVVGAGRVGRELADHLEERGEEVVLIDEDESVVESTRSEGYSVRLGDATDARVLETAGAGEAKVVAVATASDDVNLLVAQLARTRFDVDQVIARVNRPVNVAAFEELDVEPISAGFAIATAMDNAIERPSISEWITELDHGGDVQEVELEAAEYHDRPVRDLVADLPDGCLVAVVARDGETHVPGTDFTLRAGDAVTILGEDSADVHEAIAVCQSGPTRA